MKKLSAVRVTGRTWDVVVLRITSASAFESRPSPLGHTQIGQQEGHGLRDHRLAAVGANREVIATDALTVARLADELLSEPSALAMGAGEVSGEDVHDRLGQGHPQRTTHDYPTPETPPPESIRSSCHGWLAGIVMKNGGYGLTGDILLGLGGSIVGSSLFRALGIALEAG